MTHEKHTTIVQVESDDRFLYIASTIGPDTDVVPHMHKLPKLALTVRAAEYNLDVEDPLALDLILRSHWYPQIDGSTTPSYEKNGIPPLLYMPSVQEASTFMDERIEEVRVDRKAPPKDTGSRMLAGAIRNKDCTKGLVVVRDKLLSAYDRRLAEPVQFYRDQAREKFQEQQNANPVANFLRNYQAQKNKLGTKGV